MENEEQGFFGSIKAGMIELKNDFKSDKVAKGSQIMTDIIRISSVIGAIVAFIIFIVQGNYGNQWKIVKEVGIFAGFDQASTTGTAGMMYEVIGLITGLFLLVQIILFIILFFRDISKAKKVCMVLNLLLIFADILIMLIFQLINNRTIMVSQGMEKNIKSFMGSLSGGNVREGAEMFVMILFIAAITFFLLLILQLGFEIGSERIKEFGKNVAFVYIIVPLVLLFLENVIPMAALALILVIIYILFYVFTHMFSSGDVKSVPVFDKDGKYVGDVHVTEDGTYIGKDGNF